MPPEGVLIWSFEAWISSSRKGEEERADVYFSQTLESTRKDMVYGYGLMFRPFYQTFKKETPKKLSLFSSHFLEVHHHNIITDYPL